MLQVLPTGGRSWILRTMIGGRRREVGLGGYPEVPLAEARIKARETKDKIVAESTRFLSANRQEPNLPPRRLGA